MDLKDIIAPIIKKECELDASDFMDADFYGQDDEHDDENMMEDDDIQEEDKMEEMAGEYKCDMCDHITTEARLVTHVLFIFVTFIINNTYKIFRLFLKVLQCLNGFKHRRATETNFIIEKQLP